MKPCLESLCTLKVIIVSSFVLGTRILLPIFAKQLAGYAYILTPCSPDLLVAIFRLVIEL